MRRLLTASAAVLAAIESAAACPACYGAADNTAVTNGMTYAIYGMLFITFAMLGIIALGARMYRRRAKNIAAGFTPEGLPEHTPMTI